MNEGEEGFCIEGEGGSAPGVGVDGVWKGRQLGAGEVVAVHRDECGDWEGRKGVEQVDDKGGKGGFARARDA